MIIIWYSWLMYLLQHCGAILDVMQVSLVSRYRLRAWVSGVKFANFLSLQVFGRIRVAVKITFPASTHVQCDYTGKSLKVLCF